MNFERGKETFETLKIGKYRDCIRVTKIYHMRHRNAKYGTYAIFDSEEEVIANLERVERTSPEYPLNLEDAAIAFKTKDGIIEFVPDLEGKKIEYKGKIYQLPILHLEE